MPRHGVAPSFRGKTLSRSRVGPAGALTFGRVAFEIERLTKPIQAINAGKLQEAAALRALPSATAKVREDLLNADFRRGVTCLIYTQFSPRAGRFFPVFSAIERLDLGAL